ncbi:MAG: matrixin family metalloprotease [Nocardioides sp.]|nr:matrixin family metalloprotease [Nocardioides sp.]
MSIATVPQGTDVVACGLVGVYLEWPRTSVMIPTPGTGVGLAVDSVDALDTATYVVEVDLDGAIHWSAGGSGDSSSLVPSDELDLLATDLISTPSNECSDGKHNLSSGEPRWTATPTWYIDLDTVPAELTQTAAVDAIRGGIQDVRDSNNNCSRADYVDIGSSYGGDADYGSDVLGEGAATKCATSQGDSKNIVGFGNLDAGTLARTCWWYSTSTHAMSSADIKVNKNDYTWTAQRAIAACSALYDLESVMAHEFGHFYGLGHVSETKHGYLTNEHQDRSVRQECSHAWAR